MNAPTRATYKVWYAARVERTLATLRARPRISGSDIRREQLSMKTLYDHGYVLDTATDTMVKHAPAN